MYCWNWKMKKQLNQEKSMCDAICDMSDFLHNLDHSCDNNDLVYAINDDVHVSC